jgi:RNA polymerase sigma factor (sigma-70 family)
MAVEPFQRVAERHTAEVWRFCASQVGVQRADDCYQETMLAALRAYPQLRDQRAARSWLLRIAANKALDMHRGGAREPQPSAQPELDAPAPQQTPARRELAGVEDSPLLAQVRMLPVKQRQALAYRYLADLAYREIGMLMQTSEQAARRNVHEGLKTLRERLGENRRALAID